MKFTPTFSKTRISLVLVSLIVGINGCSKEPATETQAITEEKSPASSVAYVTRQDAGVSVIDLATMQVIKEFDVKAVSPRGLGVTDDGKKTDCSNTRK